jgi:predicted peptidase
MKKAFLIVLLFVLFISYMINDKTPSEEELQRISYISSVDHTERDYFVFLPKGYYSQPNKQWPVMLFLHGNGERGDGKEQLDYVLSHGPVYEAWIQKKELPFIIISPQLHMFDFDQRGIGYIDNRQPSDIPQRLSKGVPERLMPFNSNKAIVRTMSYPDMSAIEPLLPLGWEQVEVDLMSMLETVNLTYRVNTNKTYLTGLSYGGFGTWFLASKHPEKFAAIAPVVGWGHPSLMHPIVKHQLPVWQFAGGLDDAVEIPNFYAGINKLKDLGHNHVRFTVHETMGHDTWKRVYASDDLYQWLLNHSLSH